MADQRMVLQCHNWMGIPHQKLYDDIHEGSGTAAVEAAQDMYQQMQVSYAAIFATLQGGLTRLAGAHEGAAADASQAAVSLYGTWVNEAAGVAGDDHSGVSTFSTSYAFAKNDMPPPVQVTAVDSTWDDVKDFFGGTTAREAEEQAAYDAHAKAAQVMTTFFDTGAGAANSMPYWTAPQQVAFDVPVPPPSGSGGVAEGSGVATSITGGGAGGLGGAGLGGDASAGVGRVSPMPEVTSPASTAPVSTAPAATGPVTGGGPVAPAATAPAGGAGTVVPPGGSAVGAAGAGSLSGARPGSADGRGAGGAAGGGAGRAGGRGVGGGGGRAAGGGAGAGGGGSGGAARAASGAAGSGTAGSGTAGRGAAGAAGRPGMGMMPMGAAGGRGGADDTEHRRTVPLDGDLFTDERKVAPPVIGVDPED